jgi:hypothetical protein
MKALLCLLALAVTSSAWAQDVVCVRNYVNDKGFIPCDRYPAFYSYMVASEAKDGPVCTRSYAMTYCDKTKEYVRATTKDGKEICVLNNDQPAVGNFCQSLPQFYTYIKVKP